MGAAAGLILYYISTFLFMLLRLYPEQATPPRRKSGLGSGQGSTPMSTSRTHGYQFRDSSRLLKLPESTGALKGERDRSTDWRALQQGRLYYASTIFEGDSAESGEREDE